MRWPGILPPRFMISNMVTSQLPLWSDKDATEGWSVRESQRARRLTVRVSHTGRVEVVVPFRTSARAVERFLERHRLWIERKREEARRRAGPPVPFPPPLIELPACAETWRIHLAGGSRRARIASSAAGLLILAGGADGQSVRQALRRWLMERARQALAPVLAGCAGELGFSYDRMLIRRQRTRWGSCSTRGTISLNC